MACRAGLGSPRVQDEWDGLDSLQKSHSTKGQRAVVCRSQEVLFSKMGWTPCAEMVMRLGRQLDARRHLRRYLDNKRLFRATRQVEGVGINLWTTTRIR